MKLTKTDEEIFKLKDKIDKKFEQNFLTKLEEIKSKLSKYKAKKIYMIASQKLYKEISKMG